VTRIIVLKSLKKKKKNYLAVIVAREGGIRAQGEGLLALGALEAFLVVDFAVDGRALDRVDSLIALEALFDNNAEARCLATRKTSSDKLA